MQVSLGGKTALVTGAGRGIGRATALALAAAGADVAVNDIDINSAMQTIKEIEVLGRKALPVKASVYVRDEVNQMVQLVVETFGKIDILVNNAGVVVRKPAEDLSEEDWDRTTNVNLKGTFLCSQAVAKHMIEKGGGGRIINIASIMGSVALPNRAAYCASKGGVIALTRDLAAEWARHKITVNSIAPGWTITEMTHSYFSQEEVRQFLLERTPANRFGEPEDTANMVVFLSSKYCDYVTGQTIHVDGGWTIL